MTDTLIKDKYETIWSKYLFEEVLPLNYMRMYTKITIDEFNKGALIKIILIFSHSIFFLPVLLFNFKPLLLLFLFLFLFEESHCYYY